MSESKVELSCVGRIAGVFGIKGWVKVVSFTEPQENLFDYAPWYIQKRGAWVEVEFDRVQQHKTAWIAHIKGVDDRDVAETYKSLDISVDKAQFATLDSDDFYWHQLVGLRVFNQQDDKSLCDIGIVKELFETGANDVLVVSGDEQSIDQQERLVPYVPSVYVVDVDIQAGRIIVNWPLDV